MTQDDSNQGRRTRRRWLALVGAGIAATLAFALPSPAQAVTMPVASGWSSSPPPFDACLRPAIRVANGSNGKGIYVAVCITITGDHPFTTRSNSTQATVVVNNTSTSTVNATAAVYMKVAAVDGSGTGASITFSCPKLSLKGGQVRYCVSDPQIWPNMRLRAHAIGWGAANVYSSGWQDSGTVTFGG